MFGGTTSGISGDVAAVSSPIWLSADPVNQTLPLASMAIPKGLAPVGTANSLARVVVVLPLGLLEMSVAVSSPIWSSVSAIQRLPPELMARRFGALPLGKSNWLASVVVVLPLGLPEMSAAVNSPI